MKKSMRKNIFKISLSIIMCLVICVVTMGSVPAKTYTAYIDPQLKTVLSTATATDLIPIDIWLYEIDTDEIDDKVISKTGIGLSSVENEKTAATLTNTQIDSYIETERAVYAEAQAEQSQAFMNKYTGIFNAKSAESNGLFVSKYAPVIRIEITPNQLGILAKDLSVESIYFSPDVVLENNCDIADIVTGARYVRNTLGFNGQGIKIGIIEADGLPNKNSTYFTTANITYDPNVSQTFDNHANQVAYIMVGKPVSINGISYSGVAPNATLYATYYKSGQRDEWRTRVEWLLSQGVNIINMSANFKNYSYGYYDYYARWLDHLAINHSVHFVSSAGNSENNGYVETPGLAYNVITVGNYNDSNSTSQSSHVMNSSSSYIEVDGIVSERPEKPDLIAPGTNITTPFGTNSGTSFSAPYVTGIIAQLCQVKPQLKTSQSAMKAILTAAISHDKFCYTTMNATSFANYDLCGAGAISANNSYSTVNNNRYLTATIAANTANGTVRSHSFTLSTAQSKTRISLTWLNHIYITGTHATASPDSVYSMADLTLRIRNQNGSILATATLGGNVEIVELSNLSAGTYTIDVIQNQNSTKAIYYAVAWW